MNIFVFLMLLFTLFLAIIVGVKTIKCISRLLRNRKTRYNNVLNIKNYDLPSPSVYNPVSNISSYPSGGTASYVVTGSYTSGSLKISVFDGIDGYINTAPKMKIEKEKEYECIYCSNVYTKRVDECLGCGSRRIKEIVDNGKI